MGKQNLTPILIAYPVEKGDTFVLCSDGLTAVVDDGKISQAAQGDVKDAVDSLIDLTYKNGAPDNVTIVIARIGESSADISSTRFGAAS